jgi:hypothetical protein
MRQIHLWQERVVETEGLIAVSMSIELANGSRTQLWYRLPDQYRNSLTSSCDPFVIATIFLAMHQGADVRIHGEVSPSLLSNIEEFQAVWSSWRPQQYQRVQITAEIEREQPPAGEEERAISTFSGGVDSCFTVFRHRNGRCGRQQRSLQTGLMVKGFDIPLNDPAFDQAQERSSTMLASLGMDCIPIATNFRQVVRLDWAHAFGTGIASCLHVLKGGYTTGIVASSHAYQTLNFVYGSNPLTDRLLSSKNFEIVHDAALFPRLEKMRGILDWPEALENLRVCWQGEQKDRNCGRCEKCVRNILNFRILGVEHPACFEQDLTNQQIISTRVRGVYLEIWRTLLSNAKSENISEPWVQAVETAITRNKIMVLLESFLPSKSTEWLKHIKFLLEKRK